VWAFESGGVVGADDIRSLALGVRHNRVNATCKGSDGACLGE
jgi:hypothetical protein